MTQRKRKDTHDGERKRGVPAPARANAAWLGMFLLNRLGVQNLLHTDVRCVVVWCLGWAWETTWSTGRLPWRPSGAHSLLTPLPPSNPPARPPPPPPPVAPSLTALCCPSIATVISTPSWHNLCNNFLLLLLFCFYMFVETQRQQRSRQPTESVCVMNHGVPTTMCMTHNGPSPTW